MPTMQQATESVARRAIDVLTAHDLSPATRDLVTLEGVGRSGWAESDELFGLVDTILSEYEAAAVAEGNYDAVREILCVRDDCKPEQPEPPRVRERTKMEYCDRHRAAFMCHSVYRRVEVMMEGGWADAGPCEGGRCRFFPGRDFICRETCEEYGLGEMPLDWTTEPDQEEPGYPAPRTMSPRRREAFEELNAAGWPSVADDVHDGLPAATILGRLDEISQPESDAYEIVSRLADDEADDLTEEQAARAADRRARESDFPVDDLARLPGEGVDHA